ncbi:uncharacterized protein LOC116619361 [Nematostella vectensis]|uniref:uncharacterized protein LOC116619361 n=1 Tax=Nematostella vectensis TaxID=45351 RepID=UPI00207708BB|nr:uncharacterized protein LOC116619361 [Nematostella vectensis]XP_048586789.1 uncharacterized protein LOC116619361 [Nematostella vectensis]
MARPCSRLVIILCVLLLLQEFSEAKFKRRPIDKSKHDYIQTDTEKKVDEDDDTDDLETEQDENSEENEVPKLKPQKQEHESPGKKGWISTVFKGFKIGGEVANLVLSAVSLSAAIYSAVHGCCGELQEPELCEYEKQFEAGKKELKELSDQADNLQFQAEHEQLWIGKDINNFESVLFRLKNIDDEQERYIKSIHPSVSNSMNNGVAEIKKIMKEKNNTAEDILYTEILGIYQSKLDNALNIAFPALALAVPAGIRLAKIIRKRHAASKISQVSTEQHVSLKVSVSDGPSIVKQSKIGKFISAFRTRIRNTKTRLNTRFSKAFKIAEAFKNGLSLGLNFASMGFQVFKLIDDKQQCTKTKDEALQALRNVTLANTAIQEQIANITEALGIMNEAWDFVRGNLTERPFLDSLNNVRIMVFELAKRSDDMKKVADTIKKFTNNIKTSTGFNETYNLTKELDEQLIKVGFTVSCYTAKNRITQRIIRSCREGRGQKTFNELYQEEQANFQPGNRNDPENPDNCVDEIGFRYIIKEDIERAWRQVARNESLNAKCKLNNKDLVFLVCRQKADEWSAKEAVEQLAEQSLTVTIEEVEEIYENCPLTDEDKQKVCWERKSKSDPDIAEDNGWNLKAVTEVTCPWPLTKSQKKRVCLFRKRWDDAKIADFMKVDVALIEAVECPRPSRDSANRKIAGKGSKQ